MDWQKQVLQLRKMRHIERLSSTPKIKSYTLAEHCYYTGMLFIELAEKENIEISLDDAKKILMHDFLETFTGDLIWSAKNLNSVTKTCWEDLETQIAAFHGIEDYTDSEIEESLGNRKTALFKLCDLLELYMFCCDEEDLGNRNIGLSKVIATCAVYIDKIVEENDFRFCGDYFSQIRKDLNI